LSFCAAHARDIVRYTSAKLLHWLSSCSFFPCSEIEFKLRFGCDVPTHIDQGVRLEVRIDGGNWEPIRFYTPSLVTPVDSLVTRLQNGSALAQADTFNSALPLLLLNRTSETVTIREYLCGRYVSMIRANEEIRLRWMQRYKTNPMADVATWYLDDIRIRVWNRQCFTQVLSENFTAHPGTMSGVNGIEYRLRDESISENRCNGGVSEGSALYFNRLSGQDVFRRSLIIIIQPAYELGECETTRSHTSELSDHSCQLPTPKQLEERV